MKYILNKTPIRTTNGFRVNDVKVDLEIPNNMQYHDYEILNISDVESTIESNFVSNIGLEHENYKSTNINVDNQNDNVIKLKYYFNDNDSLVDNININVSKIHFG